MSGQAAVVISFLIYLAFFAWLGWRRGARREITVFSVALVAWLLLQERGDIVVSIANLGGAALTFARAGGFGGSRDEAFAALADAPDLVPADGQEAFLFGLWVVIFVVTYVVSNVAIQDKQSERNGWAILFGILNGLFFAVAFVPSMVALFAGDDNTVSTTLPTTEDDLNLLSLIGAGGRLLWTGVSSMWTVIESLGSLGLLILLTAFLVLAAASIKNGAKAKS